MNKKSRRAIVVKVEQLEGAVDVMQIYMQFSI
jgi:hypothetical protein